MEFTINFEGSMTISAKDGNEAEKKAFEKLRRGVGAVGNFEITGLD